MSNAIGRFESDTGRYPSALSDLIRRPAGESNWKGPYIDRDEIPLDHWGHEFVYRVPPAGTGRYQLFSRGADGRSPIFNP